MTSLVVLLPSIHAIDATPPDMHAWPGVPLRYALFDRREQIVQAGECLPDALPKAQTAVLIFSARDTLLLEASLPPVAGPKLRKLLPNVVEEFLIDDAQRSHIAVAPAQTGEANRALAVVDRERFGAVVRWFAAMGYGRVRAVPLVHCLPAPADRPQDEVAEEAERAELAEARREPGLALEDEDASEASSLASQMEARDARHHAGVLIVRRASVERGDQVTRIEAEAQAAAQAIVAQHATQAHAAYATYANGHADIDTEPFHDAGAPSAEQVDHVELAIRQGRTGFGMDVRADRLDTTIAELARRGTLQVWALTASGTADAANVPQAHDTGTPDNAHSAAQTNAGHHGDPANPSRTAAHTAFPLAAQSFAWDQLARNALACPFDLCQFEFANAGRGQAGDRGALRPWWPAIALVAASLVVSIAAINVQWLQLRHRQDALNAQMTALVKAAFPGITLILDPSTQMQIELKRLRSAAGELRADDYLVLAAALSRALGPISSSAIATLDYSDGALAVTFKPDTTIDGDGLRRRLLAQGVATKEDNGKWMLGSLNSTPRAPR
ncbi:general secretion pathway protein L [Paraburkholderia kururiensis]|uniref:type II secretion system protein GspL n=1 Tax=Paraburkholderia kururiensis TaxID=984307 RepID=UPI0039A6F032